MRPKRLNVVGAGNVGTTLAALWAKTSAVTVQGLWSRRVANAERAQSVIGAGDVFAAIADLPSADVWMISVPDDIVVDVAEKISDAHACKKGQHAVVFHCSGVSDSRVLRSCRESGAYVASVHPIHSFADPFRSIRQFAGTACATEGDTPALEVLDDLFHLIGGRCFSVNTEAKAHYHASTVIACNLLSALIHSSVQCLEHAGFNRAQALVMLDSLVKGTVTNIFDVGPERALTGPIVRGDVGTVKQHLDALEGDERIDDVYRSLSRMALEMASHLSLETREDLRALLEKPDE